jgi:urocanate hydratase
MLIQLSGCDAVELRLTDGTAEMPRRIERVLTNDPGIGVARHADAGYEIVKKVAKKNGIKIPMK